MSTQTDPPEPNPDPETPAPAPADAPPASPADPAAPAPAVAETAPSPAPADSETTTATATTATKPAKPKVSPARNAVSLVLLIVLLIIGGMELTALFSFKAAVDRLNQRLEENEDDLLSKPEVEELLGKSADIEFVEDVPGMRWTTYTWNGAIRSHVLTGYYSYGEDPGLVKYEIGSATADDPGGD